MERRPVIWPLDEYLDTKVVVEMKHGRQVTGVMTGFDQVGNLVLHEAVETKIPHDGIREDPTPRTLGTIVIRAPHLLSINAAETNE